MTIVRGQGVAKHWRVDAGLAPVDFALEPGTMTCVKGRSGSGKSTLLALLFDLTAADDGRLQWRSDLDEPSRVQWKEIALVPPTMLLLTELTVTENVVLAGGTVADANALLERLGLHDLGGRMTDMLSMGQRQRVAVARAVIAHPTLLLADEPTSHQDAASAQLVLDVLRDEATRGAAVVIASHDPAAVVACDAVIDLASHH